MSFINVYIHFVWSTKGRLPLLHTPEIRKRVWKHIKENAEENGIYVDFVNGYDNHCHCLVSMKYNQTIEQIMQSIKGESSFWINDQKIISPHFEWQNDYFAVSVSESAIDAVRNYIKNQEKHHAIKTFQDEHDLLMDKHNFQRFKD